MATYKTGSAKSPNPQYIVNLREVFEKAYNGKSIEVKRALRPLLSDTTVQQGFINEVLRKIQDRTQNERVDKNDKALKAPYSESYTESLAFKIYGKSRGDVNMTLTGSMMANMRGQTSDTTVVFSFASDENKAKAHGHITGHNGDWGFQRDFFGLPPKEEQQILKEIIDSSNRARFLDLTSLSILGAEGPSLTIGTQEFDVGLFE